MKVGNKNDFDSTKREVDYEEAHEFANINHMDYIETSSKEDNNVDQVNSTTSVTCTCAMAYYYTAALLFGLSETG